MSRILVRPWRPRAAALLVLAAALAGCVPPATGAAGDPAPGGAAVRISFAPRRDVHLAWRPVGDSAVVRDVRQIIGRVKSASGDTAFVTVTTAYQGASGNVSRVPQGTIVVLVLDPTTRVELINRYPAATERAIVLGFVASLGGLLLLLVAVAAASGGST